VIRPIDINLSLFNADHMANQIKDPNAAHAQGAQQIDVKKESEQMSQSVQAPEETGGEVRIGEKERQRQKQEDRKKKMKKNAADEDEIQANAPDRTPGTSRGFSFIA
jgi:hypothetical protein